MPCGASGDLYHIEFTAGKYIDFAVRQKYRIAQQYIDKKPVPTGTGFYLLGAYQTFSSAQNSVQAKPTRSRRSPLLMMVRLPVRSWVLRALLSMRASSV